MVFSVKPSSGNTMKVDSSDTGTAMSGMKVARRFCRNTNTTRATRMTASMKVCRISTMELRTDTVVSSVTLPVSPSGMAAFCFSSSAVRRSTVAMALEPGDW